MIAKVAPFVSKKPKIPAEVAQLLGAMDALSTLLDSESKVLAESDMNSFGALQPTKRELCDVYERQLKAMTGLDKLEPSLKQLLVKSRDRLATAMEQNMAAISRAENASTRLMQLIVSTVRKSTEQSSGYAAVNAGVVACRGPVSVALNKTF